MVFLLAPIVGQAQLGGTQSMSFLQVPPTARGAALGGIAPQIANDDASGFFYNPAAATGQRTAAVGYNPYTSLYKHSALAYQQPLLGGQAGLGVQYINYGQLKGYTPGQDPTGTFGAGSYQVMANYSRATGPFRVGANLKVASSYVDSYSSTGVGVDFGVNYTHPAKQFLAGFAVQNVGVVTSNYASAGKRAMPLNISAGASYRFAHLPLRLYLSAQQLQALDIVYQDPALTTRTDASGNPVAEKEKFSEKIFRHVTVGTEVDLGSHLVARAGYNHLRRKELKNGDGSGGLAGYSLGAAIKLAKFTLDYSHVFINQAGGANYLGVSYRFGEKQTSSGTKDL